MGQVSEKMLGERDDEVYCRERDCDWMGMREDLVCTDDDPDHFIYCPECESKDVDTV